MADLLNPPVIKPNAEFGSSAQWLTYAAMATAMLMLLAPALWNGFPFLQYDTGGYLARWYEHHLEESRSTVYGIYLVLAMRPDFWPAVTIQALTTTWVLWLTLRALSLATPAVLLTTTAVLTIGTNLPWLAGMLLTDIFAGTSVLALYLVTVGTDTLTRWERIGLLALIVFAAATHSATLAVLLALLAAGFGAALVRRDAIPLIALARAGAALALSVVLLLAANYAVAGRVAWTPGGSSIPFGRMLQAGIVWRYLSEHCPDPRLPKLCSHRDELPDNADYFFWGSDLFNELGRFQGLGEEMAIVVRRSLADYPGGQVAAALVATAEQLVFVSSGYGVHTGIWHTLWILQKYAPQSVPAMQAAHQQRDEIKFAVINRLHLPVAFGSMLLLVVMLMLAVRRRRLTRVDQLAVVVALTILANAAVCGALSNPNARYGARIVWMATLVVALAPWQDRIKAPPPRGSG